MTIQSLSIEYDPKNDENVFSNGDSITGRLVVQTSKETKIEHLSIKAKGKARVLWVEHFGQMPVPFYAKENIFSIEQTVLQEQRRDGSSILTAGRNVFPFSFEIPDKDLPSSFKGKFGKITYSLKAKLTRSMRMTSEVKTKFTVVSKADMSIPDLMQRQQRNMEKKFAFFASGEISMKVYTERMGYLPGEALKVSAEILNNTTGSITPKYYLYEKQCFYAKRHRKVYTNVILKEKGESVPARTQQNVTKVLNIPPQLTGTILTCPILKLEYRLKVVLDVALTKNPEVKLPIVVLADTDGSVLKVLQEKESWFK